MIYHLRHWTIALITAATIALTVSTAFGQFPVGTEFVTRNKNEVENESPGYWNHNAIVVGRDRTTGQLFLVESQAGEVEDGRGFGVILTSLQEFVLRDYQRYIAFEPRDPAAGRRMAGRSLAIEGLPHRNISSIFRRHPPFRIAKGTNCVTAAVEVPAAPEDRRIRAIKIPDDMFTNPGITAVFKEPYEVFFRPITSTRTGNRIGTVIYDPR